MRSLISLLIDKIFKIGAADLIIQGIYSILKMIEGQPQNISAEDFNIYTYISAILLFLILYVFYLLFIRIATGIDKFKGGVKALPIYRTIYSLDLDLQSDVCNLLFGDDGYKTYTFIICSRDKNGDLYILPEDKHNFPNIFKDI